MTYRYVLGYLHVARFLFGGPLVALPPEREPERPEPQHRLVLFAVAVVLFGLLLAAATDRTRQIPDNFYASIRK